jgi:hypothetical protein
MEVAMTTTRSIALLFAPVLIGSALAAVSPASAASEADGRAVAQCRAEVLRHFPAESIRNQRVASITGNARHTRVAMFVTTDRRYSFECTADAEGRVVTAAWNPPVETRLAAGGSAQGNQAQ